MPESPSNVVLYISAGSNVEPRKHLAAALDMLRDGLHVTGVSTIHQTPAIGRPRDPDFLNCVFQAETAMQPRAVKFDLLGPIEDALGRERGADRYAPRTIDLDLILYGRLIVAGPDLVLPHPDLARWFVRVGVLELSPGLEISGPGESSWDPAEKRTGEPLPDFTELLRRRLRT